ncbi:uncharacterized protein LOC125465302 isoform X2 [Stegostoma tigrinum]|uniref:uncharacterized protein LOC125465302 isoform X2 n=1 Tax=Stegostoma tigrinum TaxID=3053191 RepID=UPI00286FB366|nr:uncharacterized protein LOC125465302 isoform X2 [Stegostoma tigrinum]
MNLSLSALCVWTLLIASSCEGRTPCTAANQVFVCTTIPNASFYPPNLKHLVFVVLSGFESINNTMLSSLNLNSVTNLTVSNSDIASIEQGAFDSFLHLTGLNLNGNKLSTINAAWFSDAASLISLSLSRNRIQAIGVDTLSGFSNLVELYLSQNKISTIADQSLCGNLKLSILDLSSNKLVFLTGQALAGPNLQRISLHTNPWSCLCEHADWMSFLRDLNNNSVLVQRCAVTCNDPPNLKGIPVWNASDFACSLTTNTSWSDQHTEPQKLHPMLLGLLGLLLLLLLFLFLLVKRKQEKEQVKPDGQETNQQEKHPPRDSAKENCSKDHQSAPCAGVEVINSESCAAVWKKQNEFAPVTMSGAQQDGEHPQLAKGDPEILCITNASIVSSFSEDWTGFPSKRFVQSHQEMEKHNSIPSQGSFDPPLAVFVEQSGSALYSQSVSDSTALDKPFFKKLGRTDGDKQDRNGNGKPVGMILPLSKMSTGNDTTCPNLNSDEDLSSLANISRGPQGAAGLIHDEADEVCDSSTDFTSHLTTRQHEVSVTPSKDGNQRNAENSKVRVVGDRGAEPRLKVDVIDLKSEANFEEGSQTSTIREDMSMTKSLRRVQLSSEIDIFPGTRCDAMIPATPNSEQTVSTSSPTKEKSSRSSEYGYVNLLHEIVENQGRRTRDRWKQATRFKIIHK